MNEEERRQLIISKWLENTQRPSHFIAKELKIPRKTIDNVIKRYLETLTTARKAGSGAKAGTRDKKLSKKIVNIIKKNRSMSVRDVAKKCRTTSKTVQRVKRREGLKTYKKKKIPKVSEKQRQTIKTRARRLYDHLRGNSTMLVLDDETYVKADFSTLPGPQWYTKFEGETLPDSETTIAVEKFGRKYLVWQAISSSGARSDIFVTEGTINGKIYRDECLKKRLLPFLRKLGVPTLFWPDLASCHYASDTLDFMNANGINVVPKDMNPPNVPQCRPIERYWAKVKDKLRTTQQSATSIKDFKLKWKRASKAVDESTVKNLMEGIPQKLHKEFQKY
jgi:hypothetical protein